MKTSKLDGFSKVVTGFIRSHEDVATGKRVTDPVKWLAIKMGKSVATVRDYLYLPQNMSPEIKALMKSVICEKLKADGTGEVICKLINSIPARDRNAKR